MKILDRILKWLGFKACCKCGSYNTYYGNYTSGWNHLCEQASGDRGTLCCSCWHIEFDEPFDVRKAKKPNWVETTR